MAVPRNLKSIGLTQNLGFNSKALIGIFSQTAGSACEFWVNHVDFTVVELVDEIGAGGVGLGEGRARPFLRELRREPGCVGLPAQPGGAVVAQPDLGLAVGRGCLHQQRGLQPGAILDHCAGQLGAVQRRHRVHRVEARVAIVGS